MGGGDATRTDCSSLALLPLPDSQDSYLFAPELWDVCEDPPGVTLFNVILFSLIVSASVVELVLCLVQVFNGLFGCMCGTCKEKKATPVSTSTTTTLGLEGLPAGLRVCRGTEACSG